MPGAIYCNVIFLIAKKSKILNKAKMQLSYILWDLHANVCFILKLSKKLSDYPKMNWILVLRIFILMNAYQKIKMLEIWEKNFFAGLSWL